MKEGKDQFYTYTRLFFVIVGYNTRDAIKATEEVKKIVVERANIKKVNSRGTREGRDEGAKRSAEYEIKGKQIKK